MSRLVLLLHAHLPWVRHPEHPRFLEEDWFFEAMEEVYVPLLDRVEAWRRDGVPGRVTLSISPPLLAQLQDEGLRARFRAHLDRRSAIWSHERRTGGAWAEAECARVARVRSSYERRGGDLIGPLAEAESAGQLELATCATSHALLPMYRRAPHFVRGQITEALRLHRAAFSRTPTAFWLPECGWAPWLAAPLLEAGVRIVGLEGVALAEAEPCPQFGLRRPVCTPEGLRVLGRDPASARAVWSADVGYPGDPRYLDFHADAAADRSDPMRWPWGRLGGARIPLALRDRCVTGRADKQPYDPRAAQTAVRDHAAHFLAARQAELPDVRPRPIGFCPFDAELFGHWWREGPDFLDAVVRGAAGRLELCGMSEVLDEAGLEVVAPAPSTWGEGADLRTWLSEETGTAWSRTLDAVEALERAASPSAAWRSEVALATASDWPFLVTRGTAADYAARRWAGHLDAAEAWARGEGRPGPVPLPPTWYGAAGQG